MTEGFCLKAMEERGLNPEETDIQIGLDDGGNLIKVNIEGIALNFKSFAHVRYIS